ncbi:DMT family transporter [Aspergillus lucknowensis]|uniref:EamA domain-containing protein n=1 Tax=Aspergillus lucknowensis TaxID=176173 RepID=A0ABR4M6E4_9EURO
MASIPTSTPASPRLSDTRSLSPNAPGNGLHNNADGERTPLLQAAGGGRTPSPLTEPLPGPPAPAPSWIEKARGSANDFWLQGKGMILVMLSQFFGATMNVMTQVLELEGRDGKGFKPFQILFARMSITVVVSYLYMWYVKVPQPFGNRSVLPLLVFRAAGGFWGVYGLYYSVQYLPLSEATVLTFLAPILSCYACSIFLPGEIFTRKQQLAGFVSLIGVVLIARPFAFLRSGAGDADSVEMEREKPGDADQAHRVLAVVMALIGVLGATSAYTSIRLIGQRCHPLVSVTYFSLFTTMVSVIAIIFLPSIPLELPGTLLEWMLLIGLGVCGFLLQFLLTAGLAYVPPPPRVRKRSASHRLSRAHNQHFSGDERDSKTEPDSTNAPSSSGTRATTMLYTQMLFALFYDRTVWGSTLSAVSWIGSALILCSALYVALARETPPPSPAHAESSEENAGDDTR